MLFDIVHCGIMFHKLCEAMTLQEFCLNAVAFMVGDSNPLSVPWKLVLASVKYLIKCIEDTVWDLEKFGISGRVSYKLAFMDRAVDFVSRALLPAHSEHRTNHRIKEHAVITMRLSAAYLVNEMLARLRGDAQLAELWATERTICEATIDGTNCTALFSTKDEPVSFKQPEMAYEHTRPSKVAVGALQSADRFARHAWACAELSRPFEYSSTEDGTEDAYKCKSKVTATMAEVHRLAAKYTDHAAVAVTMGGWAEVWKAGSDEAFGCFGASCGTHTVRTTAFAAVTTASSVPQLEDSVRPPEAIGAAMGPTRSFSRATRGRQVVSAVVGSLQLPAAGCDLSPAGKDAVDPYPVTFDLPSASGAACLRANSKRFSIQRRGRECALSKPVSWVSVARVLVLAILAQLCQVALADTYAYNVPDTEIAALQDLYDATNGDSWIWSGTGNQWNFTDPNPCYDHWQGINCTQAPSDGFLHVLAVQLPGFGLAGSIPDSLAQLTQLQLLYLTTNHLTGTIPASLGLLVELTGLGLDYNQLIGTIPESLQQLSLLTELYLDSNQLAGTIPASLGQLMRLTILLLDSNRLTSTIPDSLQQLTHLRELYLNFNQLTGTIPASLGQLTQLQILGLDTNALTGTIPASLGQLTQLTFLFVDDNHLTGTIPESLQQLTQLTELYLENNQLTGTIPASLGQLTQLTFLFVADNHLTGTIPESLQQLTQLTELYLEQNQLTGAIPASLGQLTQLTFLFVADNHLTGTIPESLKQLTQLTELYLEHNQLTGTIPASLGQLLQLTILFLAVNHLTGAIPESLKQLTQLTQLYLNENKLTGAIPTSLGQLMQLTILYLDFNNLTGTIPESLQQLTQLTELYLDINHLTGTVPASLGSLTKLQKIGLDNNQLTGTIPASLGQLTQLTVLFVDGNHLTGTIPASLGQLTRLQILTLGNNRLTGTLPEPIEHLTQMIFFGVNNNKLTGTIPGLFAQLTHMIVLRLENNLLTGTIPAYLGQLPTLTVLELGFNRFTGCIPQNWSTAAATMRVLHLNENHLSGTIPESLGYMPLLLSLNLSSNHLTGNIPASFQQLRSLQVLMLHNNKLRGSIDHLFGSQQRNLSTVQLSGNQLTGTLPDAAFLLPGLTSFAAVDNCFQGTLPVDAICSSASLNALVLDGLHSAPSCERGASLSHQAFKLGSLPACLLSMPGLTTLHLSGSGLTGSLPTDANISAVLRDLSLSHNLLTGKMPDNVLRRDWDKLDLSYNRLTGTLHGARAAPYSNSTELYLQRNRLSGVIPGSVQHVGSLSLLEDNMFSCRVDRSDVPQQDSDSDKYTCGSDAVNNALYVWLGAALAAALAVCSVVLQRQSQGGLRDRLSAVYTATTPKLQSIFLAAELLVGVGAGAAAYCILVLLPVYATVSTFHPTYTYKYAWTVSGVFLSGTAAFAVEAPFLLVQLLICGYVTELLLSHAPAAVLLPHGTVPTAITKDTIGTKGTTARVGVVLLSLVVVTGINAGFVVATLRLNGRQLTVVQILLAVFKLGYNNIVAPALQGRVTEVTASLLLLVLLNVIAIPCLVVMVISPACINDAIAGTDPVTSNYNYGGRCQEIDIYTNGKVTCEGFETDIGTTTYTPPFTYSYQCSSSFVTYYAPTFVIMCIISGFVLPALRVLLLWLRCNLSPTSRLYSVVNAVTPRILQELWSEQDLAQARRDPLYRPVFNANRLVMLLLTYLALLLTFGALFPPLAVCCAVAMASVVLTARLEVGRYLAAAVDASRQDCLEEVESACVGVATPQQLRMALGLILAVSCTFYTLFLFDTLGDAVGFAGAFWVLIVVPLLPVLAVGLHRAAGMRRRSSADQAEIESTVDPEVGVELNSIPAGAADSGSVVAVATGNTAKGEPDDVPSSPSRVNPMHAP